jgi:hypothetical protein
MIIPALVFGQTLEDAVRYSRSTYYSTARTMGVAGAFGSMGGDFGAISYNPASLGNYWRSEFNISLGLDNGYSKTDFGKKNRTDLNSKFSFENIGFVTNSHRRGGEMKSINFAIGMNKIGSFNSTVNASGVNPGSIIEDTRLVSGVDYSPWNDIPIDKDLSIYESGSINELLFALGGNYNKKFIFGASIGIPFLNFYTTREYNEKAPVELQEDEDFYFRSLSYTEDYTTVGVGVNLKAGIVYILPKNIRVGFAMHTPTAYSLQDDYDIKFNVDSKNYNFDPLDNSGYFKYKFSTPWKFIFSTGKLFKSGDLAGFVNFDAEYVNYTSARYNFRKSSTDPYDLENEKIQNEKIRNNLKSAFNFRLGSEVAYEKYRFRIGTGLLDTPFSDGGYQADITYSLGFGYRANNYYIDFAYLGTNNSYSYYPYIANQLERSPSVDITKHDNRFTITTGFKF